MLQIGRAGTSDIEPIQHLLLNQFDEHSISVSHESMRQAIGELLKDPRKGMCLVARESGQIVGLAVISLAWTLEHGGKSAWLDELYVLPECRGRGVGRALLGQAVTAARELGCAAIDLEVDRAHSRAERLYAREGFQSLPRSRWVKYLNRIVQGERKLE
jgi:GNAT superfamily N-acetyltransferase